MSFRSPSRIALFLQILCAGLLPVLVLAQGNGSGMVVNTPLPSGLSRGIDVTDVEIYIKGPDQKPLEGAALVTLTKLNGEVYKQGTAKKGYIQLNQLAQSEYNVQVLAPGYARTTKLIDAHPGSKTLVSFTVQLEAAVDGDDAATDIEVAALPQKAQRALAKAIELLRANKAADARGSLETASKIAPNSAEVQYVFGVYADKVGQKAEAKSYWEKSIQLYPLHFRSLMSLSELLMAENKPAEAIPYLERAARAEPSSWRAHAIAAEAYFRQDSNENAVQQAERALELGHDRAAVVLRYIAAALAKSGDRQKALEVMESYVKDHPKDDDAQKQLANLRVATDGNPADLAAPEALAHEVALPLPSSWMPPDVDEKIPAVESGASCQINDVLQRAGKRIEELVKNVDRFTASEMVMHESINKWGLLSQPEKRKFNYLVSVSEVAPGYLNVDEYRSAKNDVGVDFPAGIETHGLPAMVLIFHPYNVGSFEIACEGLTKWNGGLAWQVHFHQRSDKPNRIRSYRIGMGGPSYPIPIKGRAWITADTFEIARLETDLIAPVPEIRLRADHTAIEYGPVHFNKRNEDMWLPQTAEVYFDWRDRRIHRRHSFNNYLLFAVDDRQTVSNPNGGRDLIEKTYAGSSQPKAADASRSNADSQISSQAKPSNWLKIMVPAVFVTSQEQAVKFYTETLGLEKKTDEFTANARKLTVALPGAQDGIELRLDSSELASMQGYQKAMYQSGTALTVFEVRDIEEEYARLRDLGVQFKMAPTKTGSGTVAVLDDTCGNWIQLVQKQVLASNNPGK